jgi:hypothetical protein
MTRRQNQVKVLHHIFLNEKRSPEQLKRGTHMVIRRAYVRQNASLALRANIIAVQSDSKLFCLFGHCNLCETLNFSIQFGYKKEQYVSNESSANL